MGCSQCRPHTFHLQSTCPAPYMPSVLRCIFYTPATDSEDPFPSPLLPRCSSLPRRATLPGVVYPQQGSFYPKISL